MSDAITQVTIKRAFSKEVRVTRQLLTQDEADKCNSMAAAIRLCFKNFPDASNGEVARFLNIRPQWVFNVKNNPRKGDY